MEAHTDPDSQTTLTLSQLPMKQLDDFAKTYLLFHGLGSNDFFEYLPLLVFVEAAIYGMDEENEALALQGGFHLPLQDTIQRPVLLSGQQTLLDTLQQEGLLHGDVQAELQSGFEYWQQERGVATTLPRRAGETGGEGPAEEEAGSHRPPKRTESRRHNFGKEPGLAEEAGGSPT